MGAKGLLLSLVLVLAVGVAPAARAEAQDPHAGITPGIGIRLADVAGAAGADARARSYIVARTPPGTTLSRRMVVSNGTGRPVHVLLYPAAAELHDGTFAVPAGHAANELSRWARVTPSEMTLAPWSESPATVTVSVPADAAPGERYGVALVELPPSISPAPTDGGAGVRVVSRVGMRLYLSVGEGAGPRADFRIDWVAARRRPDGKPVIAAHVSNVGPLAVDVTGKGDLRRGPGGSSAGPFASERMVSLAPTQSAVVEIPAPADLPAGPWTATVRLRSGSVEREATARLHFPDTPALAAPASASSGHGSSALLPALALAVALAGTVAFASPPGTFGGARRRRATGSPHDGRTTPTTGA